LYNQGVVGGQVVEYLGANLRLGMMGR